MQSIARIAAGPRQRALGPLQVAARAEYLTDPSGGIMTAQVQSLMQLLAAANFEFPVVVFPAVDAEVGEVLEADAYFVPPGEAVAVSRRLAQIL